MHKEKHFKTSHNLNHINFKIICHCSNNKLLCSKVYLVGHHSCSIRNLSYRLLHYRLVYCKVCLSGRVLSELNSTKLLKHILKFLLNLWKIVVCFTSLLAKLCHSSHIFHIISSKSEYLLKFKKSKQLLLQLLFILHSTVLLLRPFTAWTMLILNFWLKYLLHLMTNLLWFLKTQRCLSALFKCSDYTLQAVLHLGSSNMLSLFSSTSK